VSSNIDVIKQVKQEILRLEYPHELFKGGIGCITPLYLPACARSTLQKVHQIAAKLGLVK